MKFPLLFRTEFGATVEADNLHDAKMKLADFIKTTDYNRCSEQFWLNSIVLMRNGELSKSVQ